MTYRITGLDPAPFRPLFTMDDSSLAAIGARRAIADTQPGFPCRVSLEDAAPGETLILLSHAHMSATASPYRAAGPIYVRAAATAPAVVEDEIPPYLTARLLSLRAYDRHGMMVDADVMEGGSADGVIRTWLQRHEIAMIHAHFARRGCFAARIERA